MTTIDLTMIWLAGPLTTRNARRPTIAKRKRKRPAEYRRSENLSTACMTHPLPSVWEPD
jgi:hypothetical protein